MNKPQLSLSNRRSTHFKDWCNTIASDPDKLRLYFGASGYESRCTNWIKCLEAELPGTYARFEKGYVAGFDQHKDVLSRQENDEFFSSLGSQPSSVSVSDSESFLQSIEEALANLLDSASLSGIEIHVDYSSMPRSWYCRVPYALESMMRPQDTAFFWYSGGIYPDREFPTAGVDDFRIFDGVASLAPKFRTHIMGLGFDRIRSHAIWSVIDPENLIAFYADPATSPEYVQRVEKDNKDVLRSANHVLSMPIDEVSLAVDHLLAIAREFGALGDVILVPDGPKPFVLAASLLPSLISKPGVVCFHVRRRKTQADEPIDVKASGVPVALAFSGPEK